MKVVTLRQGLRAGFYHVSDDSWQEEIITWNNAPAAEGDPLASLGDVNPDTCWWAVDLQILTTHGFVPIQYRHTFPLSRLTM